MWVVTAAHSVRSTLKANSTGERNGLREDVVLHKF